MSHTDSTDDTDLSPLGSVAKHEMLEILRTRNAGEFTNTNKPNNTNEPDGLYSLRFLLEFYLYSVDSKNSCSFKNTKCWRFYEHESSESHE